MITDTARLTAGSQSSGRLSTYTNRSQGSIIFCGIILTDEGMFEGRRFGRPDDPEASPPDYSGGSQILISDFSVRCTGYLTAISINFSVWLKGYSVEGLKRLSPNESNWRFHLLLCASLRAKFGSSPRRDCPVPR